MFSNVKLYAIAAALIALALLGWYVHNTLVAQGDRQGAARVQALWDQDKAAQQKLVDERTAQNLADLASAQKTIQEQHDAYEQKLATAGAASIRFAGQLRDAEARAAANARPVSGNSNGPGAVPPGQAGGNAGTDQLSGLVAAAAAECIDNDDTLDAVVADINQQIILQKR